MMHKASIHTLVIPPPQRMLCRAP